ncbi:MAG: hypothetical protein ABSG43_17105 [Solirubrobacteraceae bacterium]
MLRPITSSRVLLVADRRVAAPDTSGGAPLRRYRLARLRLDGRSTGPAVRYDQLRRTYD